MGLTGREVGEGEEVRGSTLVDGTCICRKVLAVMVLMVSAQLESAHLLGGNCRFLFDALPTGSYLRLSAGGATANEEADSRSCEVVVLVVVLVGPEDAVSVEA